jgi:hypothetical protein
MYILWRIDQLKGKNLETNNDTTTAAKQRFGKDASTTIELLLETVLSTRSVQSDHKEDNWA